MNSPVSQTWSGRGSPARLLRVSPLSWLRRHDPGLRALRRAARVAIVMPLLFAFGARVVQDADVATFAAFGSFALLLLVDLNGSRAERVQGVAWLAVLGALLVALATVVSRQPVLAAVTMAVVGFAVLFVGVVSSELAGASTALLLAFVLPVATPAPLGAIPDRMAGWLLAAAVAAVAVAFWWPAPPRARCAARPPSPAGSSPSASSPTVASRRGSSTRRSATR